MLFGFFTFLFVQTQLNPDGSFLEAFNKPNMIALVVFVTLFFLSSIVVWYFFQRRKLEQEALAEQAAEQ
jgi:hypothetical protein